MIDEIKGIGGSRESKEAGASSLAASLQGAQFNQQVSGPAETSQAQEASSVEKISDKVDVSKTDKAEDAGGANLQAIRGSLQQGQGFEQGAQPSFALNSVSGVQSGLEPGLQKAGVFKSPAEG
ncbi:MAG: hypothetical protein RDV48_19700 [Candidatus Eremiobacteraeota bacterium]|nr:hypothetical protein [Candidatus Eremiobacteraeota bacterium]